MIAFILESAGFGEWLVLLAVVLVVVGPKRLPSAARTIGQWYSRIRRTADSFKRQLVELDSEIQRAEHDAEREAKDIFVIEGDEASAKPALEA
ncbi:MAG: twin-arginine translocase subunit TatB [Kiritimatiellae bacterium]|nr:twin-arginine translocase subunit TatB [Kiritimatiellia bacterium]